MYVGLAVQLHGLWTNDVQAIRTRVIQALNREFQPESPTDIEVDVVEDAGGNCAACDAAEDLEAVVELGDDLREEIAIARLLIEKRFSLVKNDADLLLHSEDINRMLITVERLVRSANLIETNIQHLLIREGALKIAQELIEVLKDEFDIDLGE